MTSESLQSSSHIELSDCPGSCESQGAPGAAPARGLIDEWSHESCCRATTSRKLSRSSGDCCEQCGSACGSDCSCCSTYSVFAFSTEYYAKPCSIADSNTILQKSRWQTFKSNFLSRLIKRKWSGKYFKCKSKKENEEPRLGVVIVDSGTRTVIKSNEENDEFEKLKPNYAMDVSQAQSEAKCGSSDFSIKRILSEDRKEDSVQTPSWLCCTRYQPPRIPRGGSSTARAGAGRARRAGRHARVPFTAAQAGALEAAYARAPYLAPPALRALAAALQLRDDRIKIWFQNRRARERREKCCAITPPQSTPLPRTPLPQGAHLVTSANPWAPRPKTQAPGSRYPLRVPEPCDFSITSRSLSVNLLYRSNSSFEEASSIDTSLDSRPESPLDIETVDE